MQTKSCTKCGVNKTVDQFNVKNASKDGLNSSCKSCVSEYMKLYGQSNKTEISVKGKAYYQANKAALASLYKAYYQSNKVNKSAKNKVYQQANKAVLADYMNAYRQANKAAIAVWAKAYQQARPEVVLASSANRRARKKASTGKHSAADIKVLFALQKGKCACCKKSVMDGYHVDHRMPLKLKGGNDKYNLQLLCPPCNMSKGAKHPIDFMQSRGFLL